MGLSETKIKSDEWDMLRVKLGFHNCFSISCRGRSGGLALLWRTNIVVDIRSYSNFHIDAIVNGPQPSVSHLFTKILELNSERKVGIC